MSLSLEDLGFQSLTGKVIVISGASTGIGRAAARLLARGGARVVALARSAEKLDSLSRDVRSDGGEPPHTVPTDVSVEAQCKSAIAGCLERFGRIDVLINNAAIGFPVQFETCSTEDYQRTMKTNVDGVFYLTRESLGAMRRQKQGHIVMISSNTGASGSKLAPIYSASKHAVEGLTASLRRQVADWHAEGAHIRISNIWPGTVDSDYWGDRDVPRHTFMTCEEMASFILQVVACQPRVNVTDLRVEQFRF